MSDEEKSETIEKCRQRYKINNQGHVDLGNNMDAHSTGMVALLVRTLGPPRHRSNG